MKTELRNLYDEKQTLVAKMKAVGDKVKRGDKPKLDQDDRKQLKAWDERLKEIDDEIESQQILARAEAEKEIKEGNKVSGDYRSEGPGERDFRGRPVDIPRFSFEPEADQTVSQRSFYIQNRATPERGPITDWVLRNYNVSEAERNCDMGRVLVALVSGKTVDRRTEAALKEIRSVSGSATLTEFLSATLWEAGLSKSHLAASGMQTFLMDEPTVRFPKITQYPTMEWKAENASSTDRSITIDDVEGAACTIRGFTTISQELLQDGHDVGRAVERAFSVATATSIDKGGLYGDDSAPNPRGLISLTNINKHDNNSAPIDSYDPFLYAAQMILQDNGMMPDTSIMSPEAWIALQLLKTGNEELPLPPPFSMVNHRFWETTAVDLEDIFMGGFRSMHLGIRLNTSIIVSPVLSDTYQNNVLCAARCQFFHEREEDFAWIQNVAVT